MAETATEPVKTGRVRRVVNYKKSDRVRVRLTKSYGYRSKDFSEGTVLWIAHIEEFDRKAMTLIDEEGKEIKAPPHQVAENKTKQQPHDPLAK